MNLARICWPGSALGEAPRVGAPYADVDKENQSLARPRLWVLLLAAFAALAAVYFLLFGKDRAKPELALDEDLCAVDAGQITGSATLLLDLSKPFGDGLRPGALLRSLSRSLDAGTELRAFAVTGNPASPRRFLARLCKPFTDAELSIQAAKDQREAWRDCNDLPAQLPPQLRSLAEGFCARRDALAGRISRLAQALQPPAVANAYLIEAIEESKQEFGERPRPWTLHLFSDMLQHAAWYSHLDLDWTQWRFAEFEPLRGARSPSWPTWSTASEPHVNILYTPRVGLTAAARPKRAHQGFWLAYFGNAEVVFQEQAAQPAYAAAPLMDALAESKAAEARAQLQRQREETESLLAQLAEETAALQGQRQEDLAAQQERAARQAELRRLEREIQAAQARQQRTEAASGAEAQDGRSPADEADAARPLPAAPAVADSAGETEPARLAGEEAAARLSGAQPSPEQTSPAPSDFAGETDAALLAGEEAVASVNRAQPPPEQQALARIAGPSGSAGQPPCAAALKPEFAEMLAEGVYPGNRRVNYGAGVIRVHYALDVQGNTLDDAVLAWREQSSSTRPAYLDALIEDTLAQVRTWQFDFADANADDCATGERKTATFTYRSRCVGAPVPSCRTVLAQVDAP